MPLRRPTSAMTIAQSSPARTNRARKNRGASNSASLNFSAASAITTGKNGSARKRPWSIQGSKSALPSKPSWPPPLLRRSAAAGSGSPGDPDYPRRSPQVEPAPEAGALARIVIPRGRARLKPRRRKNKKARYSKAFLLCFNFILRSATGPSPIPA